MKMSAGTTTLAATGTYLPTAVQEVEADDMPALRAKVPDGWMLLNVRRV
ncbi:hypothetical protein [Microbacterium sp. BG28]|nr:hypothetical protein [Microbacterium sp. BG28]